MFPLSSVLGSILTAVAVQMAYLRLFELKPVSYFQLIVPAFVLTCISLLIRIMDEFKDYHDDLTNFPNRPLPSGRVQKKDLIALGLFCVMATIFLSMTSTKLLVWALITLGFTFLMLKWFFIENIMRKNLPLAFITHHPVVLFNFVYLIIACSQMNPIVDFSRALYVLPLCLIFTNWEVVRKIRSPKQETSYTTYSKIFGPKKAILIAIFLQLVFTFTMLTIFHELQTKLILQALYLLVQLMTMYPSFKFLITLELPKPLKPIAESQILLNVGCLFLAALL